VDFFSPIELQEIGGVFSPTEICEINTSNKVYIYSFHYHLYFFPCRQSCIIQINDAFYPLIINMNLCLPAHNIILPWEAGSHIFQALTITDYHLYFITM
jgi:hypothetical protein